jgi:hypothetical protein
MQVQGWDQSLAKVTTCMSMMTFNDHIAMLLHAEFGSHFGEEKKAARWSL